MITPDVNYRSVRFAVLALGALSLLAGCGLPRTGPYYEEITANSETSPFDIVPVDNRVVGAVRRDDALGFQVSFANTRPERTALLAVGESLTVRVWENVENGLFSSSLGAKFATLDVTVEPSGNIYIPYAGQIRAAGRSVAGLRGAIVKALETKTRDPQVEVRRATSLTPGVSSGAQRSVKVIGQAANGGVHEITSDTSRLLGMLSTVLGPLEDPAVMQVAVRRGAMTGRIWLQDLYDDPSYDVPLRAGDTIIVERDRRAFTALGAVGGQQRIPFPTRDISAVTALGLVSGLNGRIADPSGIFIFRKEPAGVMSRLFPDRENPGDSQVAYILDLTRADGMFRAAEFQIQDGDTLYVTDAPVVRFLKVLNSISPAVNFASSATSFGG